MEQTALAISSYACLKASGRHSVENSIAQNESGSARHEVTIALSMHVSIRNDCFDLNLQGCHSSVLCALITYI